jgi:ATP-dependent DNA ligase
MPLPQFQPIPLGCAREPFSHSEWVFEVKWDGFRSLVHIDRGVCRLISRTGNQFKSFPALAETLPVELRAGSAILDGEIVCLDRHGKTQFRDLLFRRGEPRFAPVFRRSRRTISPCAASREVVTSVQNGTTVSRADPKVLTFA